MRTQLQIPSVLLCVVFSALVGCARRHVEGLPIRKLVFVEPLDREDGKYTERRYPMSLSETPPGELIERWNDGKGLASGTGLWIVCGKTYQYGSEESANLRHVHVLLYRTHPDGRGPAGRGDYRLEIDEAAIASSSGGRLVSRYESYLTSNGEEFYAWIAIVSDRPLECTTT